MTTTPSLTLVDGTATFTDDHGRVYTATDVVVQEGDIFGVEISLMGMYVTVQHGEEEERRYPLRYGDNPHITELTTIMTWSNPLLPEDTDEAGDQT